MSDWTKEKSKKVIEELTEKIEKNKNSSFILYKKRAREFLKLHNYKKMLSDIEHALKDKPHDFDLLRYLGIAHFFLGNDAKALKAYQHFIDLAKTVSVKENQRLYEVIKEVKLAHRLLQNNIKKGGLNRTLVFPEDAIYKGDYQNGRPQENDVALCSEKKKADYFIIRDFVTGDWNIYIGCSSKDLNIFSRRIQKEFNKFLTLVQYKNQK